MITIIEFFDSFIAWLLQTSLKATIIIALIIIVQTLFRNRMPAKWQHALWLLLIIRLIIPVDMPSSLSIFNLTKDVEYRYIPFDSNPHNNFQIKKASTSAGSLTFPFQSDYPENKADISIVSKSPITLFDIAKLLWLTIFFGLLTYKLFINIALRRRIQSAEPVTDARINRILDTCIRRLDLKIDVQIKTLHNIHSPFWYGLFNPRIIFPTSLLQELNDEEIEHICLHELVHYKQKDLPLSLLTTLLQLLHWFNPVIWFAFFKMRSDRELACDEIVLTRLGQHQKKQYGHTLLSLVERASPHGFLPVAVGLAETHYNMKKRVRMIAHFSHKSMWWTAVALLFISFIAVFALTGSKISATVSGTISFQNGVQPDSVHVGVYRLIPTDWPTIDYVGDPFQYATLKKPDYRFHIKPGMYTIAAWAFGYERAFAEIIVQDEKSHITINFDLAPKSLPGKITDVNVIKVSDQPYDLNPAKSVPMQRLGNVWQLHASKYMNSGEQYKFIISGEKSEDSTPFRNVYTYNPGDNQVKIFKEYATFNHLYSGSDITFDPAFFQISPAKAHITISGFDLYEQFAQVQDSLRMFDIYYHKVRREERKNSLEETRQAYVVLTEKFETLEKRYDPYLAPVFHEFWLGNLQGMHPTMIDLQTFLEKGRPDSTTLNTFLQESKFIEYFHQIVDRLQNITPDMIPVDGHLWEGLHFIRMISGIFPTLRQELNIDEDFEFDYTINFCKKNKKQRRKNRTSLSHGISLCER